MHVREDKILVITDLKMEDTSVVQCNATNKHGYVFANAYLKVEGKLQLLCSRSLYPSLLIFNADH